MSRDDWYGTQRPEGVVPEQVRREFAALSAETQLFILGVLVLLWACGVVSGLLAPLFW